MQIQLPPQDKEIDPIADFIERLKIAYRVITSKRVIVIIDNEIDVFNLDPVEVYTKCSTILSDLYPTVYKDFQENVKIAQLLASN